MDDRRSYLLEYENKPMPSLGQCVLECGGRIAFTRVGRTRFQERFARAGYDIDKIRTWDQLDEALRGSFHIDLLEVEKMHAGLKTDPLQLAMLRAFEAGDQAEWARLRRRLRARNRLRPVVGGGAGRSAEPVRDET